MEEKLVFVVVYFENEAMHCTCVLVIVCVFFFTFRPDEAIQQLSCGLVYDSPVHLAARSSQPSFFAVALLPWYWILATCLVRVMLIQLLFFWREREREKIKTNVGIKASERIERSPPAGIHVSVAGRKKEFDLVWGQAKVSSTMVITILRGSSPGSRQVVRLLWETSAHIYDSFPLTSLKFYLFQSPLFPLKLKTQIWKIAKKRCV